MLAISKEKSFHLPIRGSNIEYLKERDDLEELFLPRGESALDYSEHDFAKGVFKEIGFAPGPFVVARYPDGYEPETKEKQDAYTLKAAQIIISWAEKEQGIVENSKIFLSHKGINKPLVESIDRSLRLIGLKTWLDKDDMNAGDNLLRSIDAAFPQCGAVVFFVTGDYLDEGILAREVDRAEREALARAGKFAIIVLVLTQHGGSDDKVPNTLRSLVWKSVNDLEIIPEIIRGIPGELKSQIRYTPLK